MFLKMDLPLRFEGFFSFSDRMIAIHFNNKVTLKKIFYIFLCVFRVGKGVRLQNQARL